MCMLGHQVGLEQELQQRGDLPVCGLQAFRGVWRMREGQRGEHSSRLSYSLFVRPQV